MGEGSWSISMDQAPVDMKNTMDLKDHSPIELTWAKDQSISMDQAPVDMKLTMDLKIIAPLN
jgi:hypothetical protein